ncbi:conserved oligomeric Golgi complex subunit 8 [Ischnura elegans]|uniref:conserved oligomeric Golgi complex subunit 8 n=1 Tax=Ischnura elegans TaxID=197161 RepID=UPI001ED88F70|nr:conserved oligomeric Golgi complex subunit 8 [Ischnura elegans]
MNEAEDNFIKLLFPEGLSDEKRNDVDFVAYLAKLGSLGVENLVKEPDRLSEEKSAVLEQTQELAFTNYKTFIQTAECSREIFQKFNKSEMHLESLLQKLPVFSKKCQEFSKKSTEISAHRHLNSLTLSRNTQLLEILELPQLMNTCIQNGNYEEALELAAYVRRLEKKHHDIPIIENIVKDVQVAWQTMLQQLLAQLRTDLQLPQCLQVVTYLYRMDVFTEAELRLKFLQARDTWLQSLLKSIKKDPANQHLTKTIELTRIHLFSIVTQYKAIFSDEEPSLSSSKYNSINESAIFYSWITEKISQFLKTLEDDLTRGVGNSLDSIIGQCMYFGLSFSRIGADFRSLMAPIFIRIISQNFEQAVKKCTKTFESDLEKFSLVKSQAKMYASVSATQPAKQEQPPHSLLEFYPLAEYCNGILTAFNDLRVCAPLAVAQNVTNNLQESLTHVSKIILAVYRRKQQAFSESERERFVAMCSCYADDLIPHIQHCLHLLFPPVSISLHLGVPVQQVHKEELATLDASSIIDAISHLLPVKMAPTTGLQSLLAELAITAEIRSTDEDTASVTVDISAEQSVAENFGDVQETDGLCGSGNIHEQANSSKKSSDTDGR